MKFQEISEKSVFLVWVWCVWGFVESRFEIGKKGLTRIYQRLEISDTRVLERHVFKILRAVGGQVAPEFLVKTTLHHEELLVESTVLLLADFLLNQISVFGLLVLREELSVCALFDLMGERGEFASSSRRDLLLRRNSSESSKGAFLVAQTFDHSLQEFVSQGGNNHDKSL